jgi:hypothetical protein
MQIITGYLSNNNQISQMFEFRLYHLNRPRLREWRSSRFNNDFYPDQVDQTALDLLPNNQIVAVDCAGWYFQKFGVDVQCIESSPISKLYFKDCVVEPDLFVHKPTYINSAPILFRYPWFLKYANLENFINFLDIWCSSVLILNFYSKYIQHNYLKYNLLDLVSSRTSLTINVISPELWIIKK